MNTFFIVLAILILAAVLYLINKKSQKVNNLQEKFSQLNEEKILSEKNLLEATKICDELKNKLQESENNFSQEKSNLENQINTLKSEKNSLESKNTELTQKLKISNESLNILQDEIVELKNKIERSNLIINSVMPIANSVLQDTKIFNGHHYKVFNAKLNWLDAKKICESMGGHLATITSDEEQEFISKTFVSRNPSQCYWLGGFGDNKNWQWITGEKWTVGEYLGTKWKSWGLVAKMNNVSMTDGRLAISGKTDGTWNIYLNDKYNYICEWDF